MSERTPAARRSRAARARSPRPPAGKGNGAILEVEDIHTYYGAIHALKGITLEVREGEIVTLIGANGAGKSTTLRSINGLNHPRLGSIRFQGRTSRTTRRTRSWPWASPSRPRGGSSSRA